MATTKQRLEYWKYMIKCGLASRARFAGSDDWDKWEKYYTGNYAGVDLYANYTFALVRGMIPRTYFRNPRVRIISTRPGKEGHARIVEHLGNWMIDEMGTKSSRKLAILHAALYGTGIEKMGYDSEYGFKPRQVVGELETEDGVADLSNETLTQFNDKGDRIEYDERIQEGKPWVKNVHPRDIVCDPAATEPREIRWIAHRFRRRLKDVKDDADYSNTTNLKSNRSLDKDMKKYVVEHDDGRVDNNGDSDSTMVKDEDWVELWEVRDTKTKTVMVLGLHHDKFLLDEDDALQIEGLPYEWTVFNTQPNTVWGISDVQILQPQQLELNEVRNTQQQYRKFNRIRMAVKEGTISKDQMDKMYSEDPVAVLEVDADSAASLRDTIVPLQTVLPNDMGIWSKDVIRDMETIIGMGQNQLGQFAQSTRRTATEANIVQQGAQIRADERRDIMADGLVNIVRRSLQFIFLFWQREQVARIAGPEGMQYWVKYTGPDLKDQYNYRIEPDEALPMTAERRRQESLMLLQTLVSLPKELVNHAGLIKNVLDQFETINAASIMPQQQMAQGPMGLDQFNGSVNQTGQDQQAMQKMQQLQAMASGGEQNA